MKFYRYELETSVSIGDDNSVLRFRDIQLNLNKYNLHKETPKGYWIGYGYNEVGSLRSYSKWIPKVSKKRYAYPTKEEALINYMKRTEKRIKILESNLYDCKRGIELANEKLKNE